MREVSDFIVIPPARQGKAMRYAEQRILGHLASRFPHYGFRLEAFGPYVEEDEFSVIPIMNRPSEPGDDTSDPDVFFMCAPLDPRVIPQIREALRDLQTSAVRNAESHIRQRPTQ